MQDVSKIKVGHVIRPDWIPTNAALPFKVSFIGRQVEGLYYEGYYANGLFGVVFPEDLA